MMFNNDPAYSLLLYIFIVKLFVNVTVVVKAEQIQTI